MENIHYRKRYDKFIDSRKYRILNDKKIHIHHILPRSLGGNDNKENLIELSYREHYIAHLLLAKATLNSKMVFAWNMMRNYSKNSRGYSDLLKIKYDFLSKRMTGNVFITDSLSGKVSQVSIKDGRKLVNSNLAKYTCSGFVVCKSNDGFIRIPVEDYDSKVHEHINTGVFNVLDSRDGLNKKINKEEYLKNKDLYRTNLTDRVYVIKNGETISVSREQFKNGNYEHYNFKKIAVKIDGKFTKIDLKDYKFGIHETIRTGKVNVIFKDGSTGEVSKEEFKTNPDLYRTFRKGLVSALDIESGKVVHVSREEFKKNNHIKYRHKSYGLSLICPYCNKEGGASMKRWHFNNCKERK